MGDARRQGASHPTRRGVVARDQGISKTLDEGMGVCGLGSGLRAQGLRLLSLLAQHAKARALPKAQH